MDFTLKQKYCIRRISDTKSSNSVTFFFVIHESHNNIQQRK